MFSYYDTKIPEMKLKVNQQIAETQAGRGFATWHTH
jgi:hypothetical protein